MVVMRKREEEGAGEEYYTFCLAYLTLYLSST